MATILLGIHITACIVLIAVVLMQSGKADGLSSTIGGGMTQTVFGPRAGNFLTKLTTGMAIIFLFTSLFLARSSRFDSTSVMERVQVETEAPAPDLDPFSASPVTIPAQDDTDASTEE